MFTRKGLTVIPAVCAALIALLIWLKPAQIGDFGLGTITGILFGISILALAKRRVCMS